MFDLEGEWLTLMEAMEASFDEETGEYLTDADEIESAFGALGENIAEKLAGCGHVLRRFKADICAVAEEEMRLKAKRYRIDAARERLEERVRGLMLTTGMLKAKTASLTISLSKPSVRVEVLDGAAIPERFMVTPEPPPPKPVLADIKRALKAGEEVPGTELVEGKRTLRIS